MSLLSRIKPLPSGAHLMSFVLKLSAETMRKTVSPFIQLSLTCRNANTLRHLLLRLRVASSPFIAPQIYALAATTHRNHTFPHRVPLRANHGLAVYQHAAQFRQLRLGLWVERAREGENVDYCRGGFEASEEEGA